MKREGRQHGMVRTYRILPDPLNPRPGTRHVNKFDPPATAGLFTRVATKPTNHSKFTGKCGKPRCSECHIHPAAKAKDKAKGNQKLKSADVVSNLRLVTWRVVDGGRDSHFSGFSATEMVDHLSDNYDHGNEDRPDDEQRNSDDEINGYDYRTYDRTVDSDDVDEEKHGKYEEMMDFCHVEHVIDQIDEDEGWCLVPQES